VKKSTNQYWEEQDVLGPFLNTLVFEKDAFVTAAVPGTGTSSISGAGTGCGSPTGTGERQRTPLSRNPP
jgi:hypothetical protein